MQSTQKKQISLLYHEVVDSFTESGFQNKDNLLYMHNTDEFQKQVKEIFIADYNCVSVFDLFRNEFAKNLLFTFDDGGISALKSSKILENYNFIGHYFVTTKYIDHPLFLDKKAIISLHNNNHIIGSHSHTHPMIFRSLSYKKMIEEWKTSKKILENIVQDEIVCCSIPGGDSDKKTYESAIESGYKFIFNSEPTSEIISIDKAHILGRFSIKANTTNEALHEILLYQNHRKLQNIRKFKQMVKKIIFPLHSYIQNKKNNAQ